MKLRVKNNPECGELIDFLNEALSKRAFIILISCCRIKYRGRATSKLGLGDRTILIKSDGSLLIHQHHNLEPVNWQPPNCKFQAVINDNKAYIKGFRRNPPESLEVEINKTYLASYHVGNDTKTLELAGYEEDMRELIFKDPDLIEKGFRPTSREYQVTNGFIDVLGKDKNGNRVIIELKSRRAGINAVKQLKRYLDDFKDDKKFVRGILVAPSITEDAHELLDKYHMEFKELEPPKELKKEGTLTLDFFK